MSDLNNISEEEENYLQLIRLLNNVALKAVREKFNQYFPTRMLLATILKNEESRFRNMRVLKAEQFNLLFPSSGLPNSEDFDITLMVFLLRHITTMRHPINGFDTLPPSNERHDGADLARIKYHRNKLAHVIQTRIRTSEFTDIWKELSEAIVRISDPNFKILCEELRSQRLTIEPQVCLCRDHHKIEVSDWENANKKFIKTSAVDHILDVLMTSDVVTLVGSSGIGKSVTLRHVALHLRDIYGYQIISCRNPSDIQMHIRQNIKYVFVIDDFCGKYVLVQTELDEWYKYQSFLTQILSTSTIKVLTSCRKSVFNDCKFQLLKVFCKQICDLSLGEYALTSTEKSKLALMYLPPDTVKIIEKDIEKFDFFPLMCFLFTTRPISNPLEYFGNTFAIYEEELDQLTADTDKTKICALFLCVLFNGCLKESLLTDSVEVNEHCIPAGTEVGSKLSRKILLDIFDGCGVDLNTPRSRIHEKLDFFVNTYLTKKDNNYVFIHDQLFDYMCFYFGTCLQLLFLKHADSSLIRDRCRLQVLETDTDTFSIIIYNENEERFFRRIISDIKGGDIYAVFYNNQMKYQAYRRRLMQFMLNNGFRLTDIFNVRASVNEMDPVTPLYLACLEGYTDIVNFILVKTHCYFDNDYSPLNAAAYRGHTDIIELLMHYGANISHRDNSGHTPLIMACIGKRKETVSLLIELGADVNKRTSEGPTPLMWACLSGYKGMVDMLLYKGANIDKSDYKGNTPVMWCRKQGESGMFDLLMYKGANLNKKDNCGWSPFMWACYNGLLSTVELLFANNANINESDESGVTPLMIACKKGFTEIMLYLINKGVGINVRNKLGETALLVSCTSTNVDVLNILIDHNAAINAFDTLGETSLMKVCSSGLVRNADLLLQKGADINISDTNGFTPLLVACFRRHVNVVNIFIKHGADVNQEDLHGSTILIDIIKGESLNHYFTRNATGLGVYTNILPGNRASFDLNDMQLCIIDILLNNGISIDKADKQGKTPLMWACLAGNTSVASLLIDNGANVNHIPEHGNTIFHSVFISNDKTILNFLLSKGVNKKNELIEAIRKNNLKLVSWIVENLMQMSITNSDEKRIVQVDNISKYDINWINKDGYNPLTLSCKYGCLGIAHYLIDLGADVNIPDNDGFTSLYYSCKNKNKELIISLVSNGTNIDSDSFSPDGFNPLTYFCFKGKLEIVNILLSLKANVHVEDRLKRSPLRLACLEKHTQIAQKLIEKGADAYQELVYANENNEGSIVDFIIRTHPFVHELLLTACKKTNSALAYLLIENLEDLPNVIDQTAYAQSLFNCIDPGKALKIACKAGKLNLLKAALASGADKNLTYENNISPLMLVSYSGNVSSAQELIERGADINQLDSNGWNSLRWACYGRKDEVIRLLIKNVADFENYLLNACKNCETQVITQLIKNGANANKSLIYGCKVKNLSIIELLVNAGTSVNDTDQHDWSPLSWACFYRHDHIINKRTDIDKIDAIIDYLIEKGADVNYALSIACSERHFTAVERLINKGGDPNLKDIRGHSLLKKAEKQGYHDIANVLRSHGATRKTKCVIQ